MSQQLVRLKLQWWDCYCFIWNASDSKAMVSSWINSLSNQGRRVKLSSCSDTEPKSFVWMGGGLLIAWRNGWREWMAQSCCWGWQSDEKQRFTDSEAAWLISVKLGWVQLGHVWDILLWKHKWNKPSSSWVALIHCWTICLFSSVLQHCK